MSDGILLIALLALPFVGSIIAALRPVNARTAAAWLAGAVALAAPLIAAQFSPDVARAEVIRLSLDNSNDRFVPTRVAAQGCGFNRWMQHTRNCVSRRSVADEAKVTDLLHGKSEGTNVGPLAEG